MTVCPLVVRNSRILQTGDSTGRSPSGSCITQIKNHDTLVMSYSVSLNTYGKKCACENEVLMKKQNFFVQKYQSSNNTQHLKFVAVLNEGDKEALAILHAKVWGECYNIYVDKGSEQCGLARALVSACFKDMTKDYGSRNIPDDVNPLKRTSFQVDEDLKTRATRDCSNIIHVTFKTCDEEQAALQDSKPPSIAECYLEQAIMSGYDKLVSFNFNHNSRWEEMNTKDGLKEYRKDPKYFMEKYGIDWFFCSPIFK